MNDDQSLSISELQRSPAAKFEEVGARVGGTIISVKRTQQTDFDSGEGLTWANGDPRLQTLVEVRQSDGTETTLYARGGNFTAADGEGTSMEKAIVEAVVAAGANAIQVGATLEVVHSGLGKPAKRGLNPPKLYRAQYRPPVEQVPVSSLFSDD